MKNTLLADFSYVHISGKGETLDKEIPASADRNIYDIYERTGDSITQSMALSGVIEFFTQTGRLAELERYADERLERVGVDPAWMTVQIRSASSDTKEEIFDDELTFTKWKNTPDEQRVRKQLTLPPEVIDRFERELELRDSYDNKKGHILLTNMLSAYRRSPFQSRIQRIQTKEQVARRARGLDVEEPTNMYIQISENALFEKVFEQVFAASEWEQIDWGRAEVEDYLKVDYETLVGPEEERRDITLSEDAPGVKQGKRTRVAMAAIARYEIEETNIDVTKKHIYNLTRDLTNLGKETVKSVCDDIVPVLTSEYGESLSPDSMDYVEEIFEAMGESFTTAEMQDAVEEVEGKRLDNIGKLGRLDDEILAEVYTKLV